MKPMSIDHAQPRPDEIEIRLGGLDCADCTVTIEKAVQAIPGVKSAAADFGTARLHVLFDSGTVSLAEITEKVRSLGYEAKLPGQGASEARGRTPPFWRDEAVLTTAVAGILLVAALATGRLPGTTALAGSHVLYALAIVIAGYKVAWRGLQAIATRSFDVDFLVTIAAAMAPLINQWWEGALVMFLFAAGNAMEEITTERTRRSVESLSDLAPPTVTVQRSGEEVRIPAGEAVVGDIMVVRPGERLALDGTVVSGYSEVNEATITGESMPVEKKPGAQVYAGTLNGSGFLAVRVERPPGDTMLARIAELVAAAARSRASVERFIDRFAAIYTPAIIVLALGAAVILPAVWHWPLRKAIYDALALLLIACPCALVISTPVSIVAGVGNAARRGVLVKGGAALERAAKVKVVAFDKTGTLTTGKPTVTGVLPADGRSHQSVLALAAVVEAKSEHMLARAIVEACRREDIPFEAGGEFQSYPGEGATAVVSGRRLSVGSERLFARLGVTDTGHWRAQLEAARARGQTAVLVADGPDVVGMITLSDGIRPEARAAVLGLRYLGITHTAVLTGDHPATAMAAAEAAGVGEVHAELLPAQKLDIVRELEAKHGSLAMVGDGVNDAPALAAASLGIAVGAKASDTALQTADVAILSDDLCRVPFLLGLGRATARTIRTNIAIALVLKSLALVLLAAGRLALWMAVLSDTGASVLVILNAMRLGLYGAGDACRREAA